MHPKIHHNDMGTLHLSCPGLRFGDEIGNPAWEIPGIFGLFFFEPKKPRFFFKAGNQRMVFDGEGEEFAHGNHQVVNMNMVYIYICIIYIYKYQSSLVPNVHVKSTREEERERERIGGLFQRLCQKQQQQQHAPRHFPETSGSPGAHALQPGEAKMVKHGGGW